MEPILKVVSEDNALNVNELSLLVKLWLVRLWCRGRQQNRLKVNKVSRIIND